MNNNRFLLGFAGVCIALSVASIQPKFKGQRILILLSGLLTSQIALKQSPDTRSRWEQDMITAWGEIDKAKQSILDAEGELNRQKSVHEKTFQDQRESITRERELLRSEAVNLEAKIQAEIEASNAQLDSREKQIELTKERLNHTLEQSRRQILQDAENQVREAVECLQDSQQRTSEEIRYELEKAQKQVDKAAKETELWKRRYLLLDRPKLPRRRESMADVYCEDYTWQLWRNEPQIKADCDERQPLDVGTHFTFWLKLRDNSQCLELQKEQLRNRIALETKSAVPFFVLESKEGLVRVEIPVDAAYKPPKEYRIKESVDKLKASEPDKSHFTRFLEISHQVALLGATGDGKTVLIGNILGVFSEVLGGNTELIVVNPKPSEGSTVLGKAKYSNFKTSIYGLLEAATEVQYRLNLNEKASETGQPFPEHKPLIFFFDEYSQVAAKWNSVTVDKFERVIEEFRLTLDTQRQVVLAEIVEDLKPTKFASELLRFCWQVGRSEKVKLLISGQNLMPSVLGINQLDLWNCGFICLGDTVNWAFKSRVYDWQVDDLKAHYRLRIEASDKDSSQRFFGLYCPPKTQAYFALNPGQNEYQYSSHFIPSQMEIEGSNSDETFGVTEESQPTNEESQQVSGNFPESPETLQGNSLKPISEKELSDLVAQLRETPEGSESAENLEERLWEQFEFLIKKGKKKWLIQKILRKTGNKYKEGVDYLDCLRGKYGK